MALLEYEIDENVAILTMSSGENRFNPDFLTELMTRFDEIEQQTDARVLVVKSAHEKIFSNGIDLEWLLPYIQKRDAKRCKDFFYQLNDVFKRVLTYPLVTIAAINGHVFAGGAILSGAFDFRFMRADRGYFCLPEVDLGIPFLPGMNALLQKAIPSYKLDEMQLTGRRLTADECEAHHIVARACHVDELMSVVMEFAKQLNKERAVLAELKLRRAKPILHAIDVEDPPYIEGGAFYVMG